MSCLWPFSFIRKPWNYRRVYHHKSDEIYDCIYKSNDGFIYHHKSQAMENAIINPIHKSHWISIFHSLFNSLSGKLPDIKTAPGTEWAKRRWTTGATCAGSRKDSKSEFNFFQLFSFWSNKQWWSMRVLWRFTVFSMELVVVFHAIFHDDFDGIYMAQIIQD